MDSVVLQPGPTFYFIGVTTTRSSVMRVFPRWMEVLGRSEVAIQGIDLPIHAHPQVYRQVTTQIKADRNALGALVTTHKIDLFHAALGLFDLLDPYARLLGEVSCISKQEGRLEGHAKDPISAGMSLNAILGNGHFARTGGHVLIFGAGGAAAATLLYLLNKPDPLDRPARIILVDILPDRLAHVSELAQKVAVDVPVETLLNADPLRNDALMADLPPHSVVINATGMGKDIPGSPVSPQGIFPLSGVVWEFNYRGELDFLHQARCQAPERGLRVEDGWMYFLHGWTQVIAQVLHFDLDPILFRKLQSAAEEFRFG